MKRAVWLSYDLGIKGDYEKLYAWFDDLEAKECGDNLAFFNYDINNDENLIAKIRKDIKNKVAITKRDRIYVISKDINGNVKGRFIFGKRKSSPWVGYGTKETEIDEGY